MKSKLKKRFHYVRSAVEKSGDGYIRILLDLLLCRFFLHCTFREYIWNEFWKVDFRTRKTYAFEYHTKKMVQRYNPKVQDYMSKETVYEYLHKYLRRQYIYSKDLTFDEFACFCNGKERILFKPVCGAGGKGVHCYLLSNGLKQVYSQIVKEPNGIIEEFIVQHRIMNGLNPNSVNTIRVVTVNDNGKCDILWASQRMGALKDSVVDNACSGGLYAAIDIKTGIICTAAVTDDNNLVYDKSPVTGQRIKGFHIPMWREVLELVHHVYDCFPGGYMSVGILL